MMRYHVHSQVNDLPQSINFYSKLLGAKPTRGEGDYAKSMPEDLRINFAISTGGIKAGIDPLGFHADIDEELVELKACAQSAGMALLNDGKTTRCYSLLYKNCQTDPQAIAWEQYHTLGSIPCFSEKAPAPSSDCCAERQALADSELP